MSNDIEKAIVDNSAISDNSVIITNKGMFDATIYIEQGTMSEDKQHNVYRSPSRSYALEVICDSPATASLVAIFMNGAIQNKPVKIPLTQKYLESISMLTDPDYVTTPDYVIIRYSNRTVLRTSEEKIDDNRTFYDFMKEFCLKQLEMIPVEKKVVYHPNIKSN